MCDGIKNKYQIWIYFWICSPFQPTEQWAVSCRSEIKQVLAWSYFYSFISCVPCTSAIIRSRYGIHQVKERTKRRCFNQLVSVLKMQQYSKAVMNLFEEYLKKIIINFHCHDVIYSCWNYLQDQWLILSFNVIIFINNYFRLFSDLNNVHNIGCSFIKYRINQLISSLFINQSNLNYDLHDIYVIFKIKIFLFFEIFWNNILFLPKGKFTSDVRIRLLWVILTKDQTEI